jgi:CheY-like chemotaxis protein
LSLIDEVLDISQIESGDMSLSIEPILVADVLVEATSLMGTLAAQRGIRMTAIGDPGIHVLADRQRLTQVLLNLLANGVKYNSEGGELTVSWATTDPETLRISITDSGAGIQPAMMDRLFTPFDRLGAEASLIEGSGLGLALSKKLVDSMGGSIAAASRLGEGTTLTVDLKLATWPSDELLPNLVVPRVLQSRTHEATVLYIEDNLASFAVVEAIFARLPGTRLLSAMQGRLGIDLAVEHRPEVILLDLQLPDVPGEQVLYELQTRPETRAIPVVVISANVSKGWQDRLRDKGAFAVLGKPLDVHQFSETIDRALSGRTQPVG